MSGITSHKFTNGKELELEIELPQNLEESFDIEIDEGIVLNLADNSEQSMPLLIDFDAIEYDDIISIDFDDEEETTPLTNSLGRAINYFVNNNKATYDSVRITKLNRLKSKHKSDIMFGNDRTVSIYMQLMKEAVDKGLVSMVPSVDEINRAIRQLDGYKKSLEIPDFNIPTLTVAEQANAKHLYDNCRNHIALAISTNSAPFAINESDSAFVRAEMESLYEMYTRSNATKLIDAVVIDAVTNPFEPELNKITFGVLCDCGAATVVPSIGKVMYNKTLFYSHICSECGSEIILPLEDMDHISSEVKLYIGSTEHVLPDEFDIPISLLTSKVCETHTSSNLTDLSKEFEREVRAYVADLRGRVSKVHILNPKVAYNSLVTHIADIKQIGVDGLRDIARGAIAKSYFFRESTLSGDLAKNTIQHLVTKLSSGESITYSSHQDFTAHISNLLGRKIRQNQLFDGRPPFAMNRLSLTKLSALVDTEIYTPVLPLRKQAELFMRHSYYFSPDDGKRYDKKLLYNFLPDVDDIIEPHLLKIALFVAPEYIPLFWKEYKNAQKLVIKSQSGALNLQSTDDVIKGSLLIDNVAIIKNKHLYYSMHEELIKPELDFAKLMEFVDANQPVLFQRYTNRLKAHKDNFRAYPELIDVCRRNTYAISTNWHINMLVIDAVCNVSSVRVTGAKKVAHMSAVYQLTPPNKSIYTDEAFEDFCYYVKEVEAPLNYDTMNSVLGTSYAMIEGDDVVVYDIDEMLADFVYDNKYFLQFKEVYYNGSELMKDKMRKVGRDYDTIGDE